MADPQREPESRSSSDLSDPSLQLFDEDEPGFARVGIMQCPLCTQPNPENHKYCGFCGVPLHAPLLSPGPANPADFSPPVGELQFLRNRSPENGASRDRRGWLYLVIGIAVLLAGFAGFERYYDPDSEPRAAVPAEPAGAPPVQLSVPAQSEPVPSESQVAPRAEPPMPVEPAATTAERLVPASRVTAAASATEDGSQELAAAMKSLSPTNPNRNATAAANLLWKSVGKGNVGAEVTLADLYLRGEGVSRSCEQGRLLLRTAAGKGSPEAATKLRTLQCK